jgi:hypothetical protein
MKLDRRLIDFITRAIASGCDFQTAARLAKVDRRTFFNWRQRGKKETTGLYRELVDKIQHADSVFVNDQLANIQKHSRLSWQASAWLLERRRPELFAKITDRRELDELRKEVLAIRGEMANRQTSS